MVAASALSVVLRELHIGAPPLRNARDSHSCSRCPHCLLLLLRNDAFGALLSCAPHPNPNPVSRALDNNQLRGTIPDGFKKLTTLSKLCVRASPPTCTCKCFACCRLRHACETHVTFSSRRTMGCSHDRLWPLDIGCVLPHCSHDRYLTPLAFGHWMCSSTLAQLPLRLRTGGALHGAAHRSLSHNALTGSIPASVVSLSNLISLCVHTVLQ